MKLYLSSYKFGDHIGQLDMLMEGYPKKALIIANSADQFPEDGIAERVNQDIDFFESRGISASRLDLRDYFGSNTPDTLEKELRSAGLLWFRGGNVFVLRRALRQSQLDKLLPKLLREEAVVYGGFSAGGCVLSPSLSGIDLVDDPTVVPEKYNPETIWEGVGILGYSFVPHYHSDHPDSEDIEKCVAFLDKHNMPYKALRDGEVIVVDGEKETFFGFE